MMGSFESRSRRGKNPPQSPNGHDKIAWLNAKMKDNSVSITFTIYQWIALKSHLKTRKNNRLALGECLSNVDEEVTRESSLKIIG